MIPTYGAVEAFLAIFNNLPQPISAYLDLVFWIFVISSVFTIALRLK